MKIAVVHPFQQHSYRIAEALQNNNYNFTYITSIYNRNRSLTKIVTLFLSKSSKKRAKARNSSKINSNNVKVICEVYQLFILLLNRILYNSRFHKFIVSRFVNKFNKKTSKLIKKEQFDLVISFDTHSFDLYKFLGNYKIIKVLDMSAPNLIFMNNIFHNLSSNDIERKKYLLENKKHLSIKYELSQADYFLVASNFTKNSLADYTKENQIFKIPYGIDILSKKQAIKKELIVFGFVGRVTYEKGAYHLLDAIEKIDSNKCRFEFYGNYDSKDKYINRKRENVYFNGHVPKEEMLNIYDGIDFLVFPSLADGFGFAALEAMSKGIPVICSKNAGMSDLIIDNESGFIIEAGNTDDLKIAIEKCIDLNANYDSFSKKAALTAAKYSWYNYYDAIGRMIVDVGGEDN